MEQNLSLTPSQLAALCRKIADASPDIIAQIRQRASALHQEWVTFQHTPSTAKEKKELGDKQAENEAAMRKFLTELCG
jgi:plasmid maintenance system antidote protein VapI